MPPIREALTFKAVYDPGTPIWIPSVRVGGVLFSYEPGDDIRNTVLSVVDDVLSGNHVCSLSDLVA